MTKTNVILFKPSGKYYTEEQWEVPEDAIGPFDMINSPDFRRIDGGPVLINDEVIWGYPCLFPAVEELFVKANRSGIPKPEYNYGSSRMSEKEYKELVEKMKAPGYRPFQVLPPEPVSEQEKFFKALNQGKVKLVNVDECTLIQIDS